MRKALAALVATVTLAVLGLLAAVPRATTPHDTHHASAGLGLDILSLTQRARDLPHQSYPAH